MFLILAGSLLNVMAAEYLKVPISLGTSITGAQEEHRL
jgi:phosphate/sulfate permease